MKHLAPHVFVEMRDAAIDLKPRRESETLAVEVKSVLSRKEDDKMSEVHNHAPRWLTAGSLFPVWIAFRARFVHRTMQMLCGEYCRLMQESEATHDQMW